MAKTFKIPNWEEFQNYKDRTPPWIRLYNELLDKYEWGLLSDAGKGHLVAIWLLASRRKNSLPWDAEWIAKRIQAKTKVNLDELQALGFIEILTNEEGASNVQADCLQNAWPEQSRGEKRRAEGGAPKGASLTPEKFIEELKPEYPGIDLDVELRKMRAWHKANPGKRKFSKRFMVNWLNRVEAPLKNTGEHAQSAPTDSEAWAKVIAVTRGQSLTLDEITRRAAEYVGWEKIKDEDMQTIAKSEFLGVYRSMVNKAQSPPGVRR